MDPTVIFPTRKRAGSPLRDQPPEKVQKINAPVPPPNNKMREVCEVFVKMPTGKTLQLEIDPSEDSCLDLKRKITTTLLETQEQSYEPHQQILSYSSMFVPRRRLES